MNGAKRPWSATVREWRNFCMLSMQGLAAPSGPPGRRITPASLYHGRMSNSDETASSMPENTQGQQLSRQSVFAMLDTPVP